jgi:hypothetical protein
MSFRLRHDADNWFQHMRGKGALPLDFDRYYFCLMAGLAGRRKEDVQASATREFIDYFPGAYKTKGRLIVALFLNREIEGLGIKPNERTTLYEAIEKLVDPVSVSYLSDFGMKEMNRFSYGGFDLLSQSWFSERPRNMEVFLPLYKRHLDDALAKKPT